MSLMPTSERCPIGSLNLHTYNAERTECIWCGPGQLAWKPGHWVPADDGTSAWSTTARPTPSTHHESAAVDGGNEEA